MPDPKPKIPKGLLELLRRYGSLNTVKTDNTAVASKTTSDKIKKHNFPGDTIRYRNDFRGNFLSYAGSGGFRRDVYGKLGDLYRYYGGDKLKHNVLEKSKYKPSNSSNPNAEYVAIKDKGFRDHIRKEYDRIFKKGDIRKAENDRRGNNFGDIKINDNTYQVSGYPEAFYKGNADYKRKPTQAIGRYRISVGEDKKGKYISYYDVFDAGSGDDFHIGNLGHYLGATKPFEIYDRIYLDKDDKKANNSYNVSNMSRNKKGLGGFLKKALPIAGTAAGFIPGVGTAASLAIGMGSKLAANAIPGDSTGSDRTYRTNAPMSNSRFSFGKGGLMTRYKKATGGTLSIGQDAKEFKGPRHEAGGIPTSGGDEVEGGETMDFVVTKSGKVKNNEQPYVFSDRLKVPGSNLTFAKKHKELVKRNADEDAILSLAHQQEKVAGRSSNPNKTSIPSSSKRKNDGGLLNPQLSGPIPHEDIASKTVGAVTGEGGGGIGGFLSSNAKQIANFLPDAVNLATGVFGKDKTRPATQVNQRAANDFNTRYNINPLLSRNSMSYRAVQSDPSANSATKLAAHGQKLQSDSDAFARKKNIESQLEARKAGVQAGLDRTQAGLNERFRQDKMASEANLGLTGNFARSSIANISNKVRQMIQDKEFKDMDQETLKSIIRLVTKGAGGLGERILDEINV